MRRCLKSKLKIFLQENSGQQKGRNFGSHQNHNEAVGRMDLVADDIHKKVKHVGGNLFGVVVLPVDDF
jgi:hypothetical protein